MELDFIDFNNAANLINKNAIEKGFWDEKPNYAEKLMLIVSEISEALEALRNNNFTDARQDMFFLNDVKKGKIKIGDNLFMHYFENNMKDTFEDELADAVIRIIDLAKHMDIDLTRQVILKHYYNTNRPFKHNKEF